jgi:hypothetical protein
MQHLDLIWFACVLDLFLLAFSVDAWMGSIQNAKSKTLRTRIKATTDRAQAKPN